MTLVLINVISVVIIYLFEIGFFSKDNIMCEITSSTFQPKVKKILRLMLQETSQNNKYRQL